MLSVQFLRFEQSNCSSTVAIRMVADVEYGFRYDPMFLAHCTHTGQHNSNCLLVFPIPPAEHLITSLAAFVHYYFISDFIHLFYAIITFCAFLLCWPIRQKNAHVNLSKHCQCFSVKWLNLIKDMLANYVIIHIFRWSSLIKTLFRFVTLLK